MIGEQLLEREPPLAFLPSPQREKKMVLLLTGYLHITCQFTWQACQLSSLHHLSVLWASLVAQMIKRLPAMWETKGTGVRSLGQEDPLEKEMATHSNTLAWIIPWTEEPGRLQSTGSQKVRHD